MSSQGGGLIRRGLLSGEREVSGRFRRTCS